MEAEALAREIRFWWKAPPRLSLSDWTAENFRLSAESSAEAGKFHPYPFQREILDALGDPTITQVTVKKSARVGWTKCLNATVAYYASQDPSPIMVVQPTIGDAELYSKREIAPMIRDTPILQGVFPPPAKRDGGNTVLLKNFPGGFLQMVGADSPRGFRAASIRVLLMDEMDGWAPTAGEEGDQEQLAIKRTQTFHNRKIAGGSTPTLDSTSRVDRRFQRSDQRYYHVPCPNCQHPQVLVWSQFRWTDKNPETVRYHCEACDFPIPHDRKQWMVETAYRRQLDGDATCGWVASRPDVVGHAGFHVWAAYSYAANATWPQLVSEWLEGHKDVEARKVFTNTILGETYKADGDAPEWKKLYDRREQYPEDTVPDGALLLFAGADVQKDRIEVEVVAYGPRMESWSVCYRVFPGDPADLDGPESPWRHLEAMLRESWPHGDTGVALQITAMAVDTGYLTNTVYNWCARWPVNRVLAVDGRDSYQMILGQPKQTELTRSGEKKKKKRGVMLWPVGVSLIKTELYGWLKQEKPTDESGAELPWGWCHFPQYAEEYFKQLTAEEIIGRLVKGFRKYHWEVTRRNGRNEALDCRAYARAATGLLGIDKWTAEQWEELRAELVGGPADDNYSISAKMKTKPKADSVW